MRCGFPGCPETNHASEVLRAGFGSTFGSQDTPAAHSAVHDRHPFRSTRPLQLLITTLSGCAALGKVATPAFGRLYANQRRAVWPARRPLPLGPGLRTATSTCRIRGTCAVRRPVHRTRIRLPSNECTRWAADDGFSNSLGSGSVLASGTRCS